ncbi:uncharacterized protein MONOS_18216 [Monocercomonoides exilis]|uniref:uncharacterized protein n=1 Tax=Monocercomonoides exilis TaxID=2049356 RepID=UPI003559F9B7|nr:hypothetical protein MONOS_18216 [Monocercomonoides exilis]
MNEVVDEICQWNGSLVHIAKSSVIMKETTISNSSAGGLSVSDGSLSITKGEFENNNPSVEGYPSARRNIICSDCGMLNVVSLKGEMESCQTHLLRDSWNDGCELDGMAGERISPFFIPILDSAKMEKEKDSAKIVFEGSLLLPCNLSFQVVISVGDEKSITTFDLKEDSFGSETNVFSTIDSGFIDSAPEEAEISVRILFGRLDAQAFTSMAVLRNRSEPDGKGDGNIVKEENEAKSSWFFVVIILAVVLLIVLVVSVIAIIRWRSAKEEARKYKEIVDDTIKKDPKVFEMVTMEMSPEEQWRRAEKEAEKKNEERIKKSACEKLGTFRVVRAFVE